MDYTDGSIRFAEYVHSDQYIPKSARNMISPPSGRIAGKKLTIVVPRKPTKARKSVVGVPNKLAREFGELAIVWVKETKFCSNPREAALHPAYQRIIGMGPAAVPLVIEELRKTHDLWFWALRSMTGVNPVPAELRGDIDQMRICWLEWWDNQQKKR